jgi:GNAT superfamily N-acetyltransferase
MSQLMVRPSLPSDHAWIHDLVCDSWGTDVVVSRGIVHHVMTLPAFIAEFGGHRAGLCTYRMDERGHECEVVTLDAVEREQGVGRALLTAVADLARHHNCRRLWLVTSNDNLHAVRFYQRLGWDLVAVHRDAVTMAREIKPRIPLIGDDDIAVRHELELELLLD